MVSERGFRVLHVCVLKLVAFMRWTPITHTAYGWLHIVLDKYVELRDFSESPSFQTRNQFRLWNRRVPCGAGGGAIARTEHETGVQVWSGGSFSFPWKLGRCCEIPNAGVKEAAQTSRRRSERARNRLKIPGAACVSQHPLRNMAAASTEDARQKVRWKCIG